MKCGRDKVYNEVWEGGIRCKIDEGVGERDKV